MRAASNQNSNESWSDWKTIDTVARKPNWQPGVGLALVVRHFPVVLEDNVARLANRLRANDALHRNDLDFQLVPPCGCVVTAKTNVNLFTEKNITMNSKYGHCHKICMIISTIRRLLAKEQYAQKPLKKQTQTTFEEQCLACLEMATCKRRSRR